MSEEEAQAILDRALEYLKKHGWKRGTRKQADGPCCVLEAIESVEPILLRRLDAAWLLLSRLPPKHPYISQWNDEVASGFEEVEEKLRGLQP